jgi:hypothetical protein
MTTCQKCGGEVQGWLCQGCGQAFRESDAGALVFDAAPPVDGWQPIETAPRDGTWILIAGGKPGYGWSGDAETTPAMVSARYQSSAGLLGDYWQFAHYDSGYYGEWENPTHWMPLRQPPNNERTG